MEPVSPSMESLMAESQNICDQCNWSDTCPKRPQQKEACSYKLLADALEEEHEAESSMLINSDSFDVAYEY
jgi:hypothetical protein